MKILYVKNNSERSKDFQLKTVVYEEDNQKYIKKQALNPSAISHLKKMKHSYENLSNAIIDPKVKLAKIIHETEDSLTFEFIEGESLEQKFTAATKMNQKAQENICNIYIDLVRNSFKTVKLDQNMINSNYQTLFGELNFSPLEDELCFDGISNIDLIFSNIIYKDDDIYLIDYEWVFEESLPGKLLYPSYIVNASRD